MRSGSPRMLTTKRAPLAVAERSHHSMPFIFSAYDARVALADMLCAGNLIGAGKQGVAILCPQEWCERGSVERKEILS